MIKLFRLEDIDLHRLNVFCTVVKKRSITSAATSLHLDKSTVSFHIHQLEKLLGIKLLKFRGNQLSLTEAGSIIALYGQEVLVAASTAESKLNRLQQGTYGSIRIALTPSLLTYIAIPILHEIEINFPDIHIQLNVNQPTEFWYLLLENVCDMAITPIQPKHSDLLYKEFFKDRLVIAIKNRKDPIDLGNTSLTISSRGTLTRHLIDSTCDIIKLGFPNIVELNTSEQVKNYISTEKAAGLFLYYTIMNELKHGKLILIENLIPPLSLNFYFAYHKNKSHDPKVEQFMQIAKRMLPPEIISGTRSAQDYLSG